MKRRVAWLLEAGIDPRSILPALKGAWPLLSSKLDRGREDFSFERMADNVYAWVKEQAGEVSHEMFGGWMYRNKLSLSGAADALGISRRMVSYYRTAHKTIPRSIWLDCLGWEVMRPKARMLPRELPSAREYATAHA